jgi:hypothetical protein
VPSAVAILACKCCWGKTIQMWDACQQSHNTRDELHYTTVTSGYQRSLVWQPNSSASFTALKKLIWLICLNKCGFY